MPSSQQSLSLSVAICAICGKHASLSFLAPLCLRAKPLLPSNYNLFVDLDGSDAVGTTALTWEESDGDGAATTQRVIDGQTVTTGDTNEVKDYLLYRVRIADPTKLADDDGGSGYYFDPLYRDRLSTIRDLRVDGTSNGSASTFGLEQHSVTRRVVFEGIPAESIPSNTDYIFDTAFSLVPVGGSIGTAPFEYLPDGTNYYGADPERISNLPYFNPLENHE